MPHWLRRRGYQVLFRQLEQWLAEITGFAAVSLQPNAGSQGEYAGLLAIRAYHAARGEPDRLVCLIPASAHGTNPASAAMAGLKVVAVACDQDGNIDLAHLRGEAEAHRHQLAALMVTYPSTHGVFEETIRRDLRPRPRPGWPGLYGRRQPQCPGGPLPAPDIGADVCHLNLHKTFCIPHGGGGPGMRTHRGGQAPGALSSRPRRAPSGESKAGRSGFCRPWGSAGILPIPWVYIAALGGAGLTEATQYAILNANYVAARLQQHFPVLYRGRSNRVAHECILDLRHFKSVTVEDVAKRLMDYGFHAPTISWPVPGTLMVEPTESESKDELDRFCEALIAIHAEMQAIESGQADKHNNLLKNAPHTADMLTAERWPHPYPREQACFPAQWLHDYKFWPAVGRIDNAYGDRNLVCSCAGMEAYGT